MSRSINEIIQLDILPNNQVQFKYKETSPDHLTEISGKQVALPQQSVVIKYYPSNLLKLSEDNLKLTINNIKETLKKEIPKLAKFVDPKNIKVFLLLHKDSEATKENFSSDVKNKSAPITTKVKEIIDEAVKMPKTKTTSTKLVYNGDFSVDSKHFG